MFMTMMESAFQGVFSIWFTPLHFPEPIGTMEPATILLFFTACGLIADTVSTIGGRD